MLKPLSPADFDRFIDWAYELAMDRTRSGYPTYTDGVKTKADFVRREREGLERDDEELLLACHDGRITGWIHWYALPAERYAAACAFLTASHTAETLAAFENHVAARCCGFTLSIGFPEENSAACQWAQEHGFALEDDLVDTACRLESAAWQSDIPHVKAVTKEDFEAFRRLHDTADMFWTSERMLQAWDRWRVFLYVRDGQALAAAYMMTAGDLPELFGLDGDPDEPIRRELISACLRSVHDQGRRRLVYFCTREETPLLRSMGFSINGVYRGYSKILGGMNHGGTNS